MRSFIVSAILAVVTISVQVEEFSNLQIVKRGYEPPPKENKFRGNLRKFAKADIT